MTLATGQSQFVGALNDELVVKLDAHRSEGENSQKGKAPIDEALDYSSMIHSTGRWLEVAWTRTSIPKLLIPPYIGRGLPSSPMRQIISSFQVTPTHFPKLGLLIMT